MQGTSCPECLRAGVSGVGRVTGKGWARAGTRAGLGFLAWRSGVAVFRVGRESRVGRAERRCGGGFVGACAGGQKAGGGCGGGGCGGGGGGGCGHGGAGGAVVAVGGLADDAAAEGGVGGGLPRVFRTGELRLIHAANCPFRYSSWTSFGVR